MRARLAAHLRTGVRIWINDTHNPAPYWSISSRPVLSAAALATAARERSPPSR
ncbi:DUF3093 family protein [Nocardioides cremeus]|uniref:DUF3093 family protein n=1 Tax=Nocardioides cremeus TaxID=3058044 RepID=UPI0034DE14B2